MFLFGPPNIEEMKARSDVKGLIKALDYEKDILIMDQASKALGEIGLPAVQPLVSVLQERKEKTPAMAILALEQIGAPAVEPLIAALNDKNDVIVGASITTALKNIGQPSVEPLIRAFRAGNLRAGLALGRMPGFQARDVLIEALEHGGRCDDDELYGEGKLLASLAQGTNRQDYEDGMARLTAIHALSKIHDSQASQALIRRVESRGENSLVRLRAAELLAQHGEADPVVSSIIDLLDDKSSYIRQATATLLGKIGDRRAVGPLTHLLQDNDPPIREAAAEALKRLKA